MSRSFFASSSFWRMTQADPIRDMGISPLLPYTRLGFSPHAIFKIKGWLGNNMSATLRPLCLIRTPWPPMVLPEPGITFDVVTPPLAMLRRMAGSSGFNPSMART
eukprot:Lithocolla_globosa_v1_NODE_1307_length_2687_cov_10.180851.p2 type:complete len:105 gc:universal NODE_1307_length_2687_cov_10.180851:1864-2178(+)